MVDMVPQQCLPTGGGVRPSERTGSVGVISAVSLAFSLRYLLTLAALSAACFCILRRLSYVDADLTIDSGRSRLRFPVWAIRALFSFYEKLHVRWLLR